MKKVFYILVALSVCLLSSCQKEEVGATATVEMAGEWYVTVDGYANGEVVYEDPFDMGNFLVLTSNTAQNIATEMLLSDDPDNTFWDFKLKITADPANLTFSATDADNLNYDCKATVTGGKIVKGGAKTPSGQPADYIEFHVRFSDDEYADAGYWEDFFFHGYRYTGFAADE